MAITLALPQDGRTRYFIAVDITDFGIKNHLEFSKEQILEASFPKVDESIEDKARGVFGYVSFGITDGVPLIPTILWQPSKFINYRHSVFSAPVDAPINFVRFWTRKGVKARYRVQSKQFEWGLIPVVTTP